MLVGAPYCGTHLCDLLLHRRAATLSANYAFRRAAKAQPRSWNR